MVKNFKLGLVFGSFILVALVVFVMASSDPPTALTFTENTTPEYNNDSTFFLNWTTGGGNVASNYTIYISIDGGANWFNSSKNDSALGYAFVNTSDANYTFQVSAINATLNESVNSSQISMTVDTTNPAIEYNATGMNVDNANVSQNWVSVNITASDTNNATVSYSIYNSTGIWNQTNFTDAYATTTINWTGLVDGVYYYNVTANDSATNTNTTTMRTITLDTTNPAVVYTSVGINVDNANVSQTWVSVNITASDTNNATAASINFVIYNSTGIWNQTNFTDAYATTTINWTGLVDGVYTYNVTVNDTATNTNSTSSRTITLDTTNPVATLSCSPSSVSQGDTVTCTCSGTDGGSGINSALTSAATTPSTTSTGTYTVSTCSVSDYAGNSASTTDTYSVSGISSSRGSGSSSSTSFWTKGTHSVSSEQFTSGFTKQLSVKQRLKIQVGSSDHHVGITGLTATTATINISSDPQQAVLAIGDERKFEVSGDNYYDILVKLNSIENNKADITIRSISELVSEESVVEEAAKEEGAIAGEEPVVEIEEEESMFSLWWIVVGLVVIVGLAVAFSRGKNKK